MHYMKWIRVMLPVIFEEFELACIFLIFFSSHYHFQFVKGKVNLRKDLGGNEKCYLQEDDTTMGPHLSSSYSDIAPYRFDSMERS